MSYATATDLRGRLGSSIATEIYGQTDTACTDDLASATAEIDGAVSVRYALPVTGTRSLALLRDWCLTLGEERAYARAVGLEPERIKTRCDQVRKYLEMVRDGSFRLPDAAETSGSGAAFAQISKPVFTRESMEGL